MENRKNTFTTYYRILPAAAFAIFLAACGGRSAKQPLSSTDEALANQQGIDKEILQELRTVTDSAFAPAAANPDAVLSFKDSLSLEAFKKKNIRGIQFRADENNATAIVNTLASAFRKKGLYMYISESGPHNNEITVLKTDDKFDLLRFEGTNGINYDVFCEDIIAKLTGWDKSMDLQFTSAGFDFAEARIGHMPDGMPAFAQELYTFCPDLVDQGTGTVERLQDEIIRTRSLYLWWD